jgi:hypothetical protein
MLSLVVLVEGGCVGNSLVDFFSQGFVWGGVLCEGGGLVMGLMLSCARSRSTGFGG